MKRNSALALISDKDKNTIEFKKVETCPRNIRFGWAVYLEDIECARGQKSELTSRNGMPMLILDNPSNFQELRVKNKDGILIRGYSATGRRLSTKGLLINPGIKPENLGYLNCQADFKNRCRLFCLEQGELKDLGQYIKLDKLDKESPKKIKTNLRQIVKEWNRLEEQKLVCYWRLASWSATSKDLRKAIQLLNQGYVMEPAVEVCGKHLVVKEWAHQILAKIAGISQPEECVVSSRKETMNFFKPVPLKRVAEGFKELVKNGEEHDPDRYLNKSTLGPSDYIEGLALVGPNARRLVAQKLGEKLKELGLSNTQYFQLELDLVPEN